MTKKAVSQEDLVTGKLYPWTPSGYAGEPITRLLPVSNTRGIRVATRSDGSIALVVLYDTAEQSEWPNSFDENTGIMTYYGDNRDLDKPFDSKPGNVRLQEAFGILHDGLLNRVWIPLFLVFQKSTVQSGVIFAGKFIPGGPNIQPGKDLTVTENPSNLCVKLTKLDADVVSREFLNAFMASPTTKYAPASYKNWTEGV